MMSFEEKSDELAKNFASLGFDLPGLVAQKKLSMDFVRVERSEIEETGEYDLEGLFVRLGYAIDAVKAKRVVLDTIESLFSGLGNAAILRAELRRLFGWLKQRGVTAVITGERGDTTLTREGLEEYVSDCVIMLDHRVDGQVSTRRLRVVKYRGSAHGTNEYPFLIDDKGIQVMPVTSVGLEHEASIQRVSTGIPKLDKMLGGKGWYRGSSVLISGTAGTGKTTFGAAFVDAACRRGERCLYFAFEESPKQIARNIRSLGIDLEPWQKKGLLHFFAARPSLAGLEMHLARMYTEIEKLEPDVVVVDPISNLISVSKASEVQSMLLRLIDHLKSGNVTSVFTSLSLGGEREQTDVGVSSLMDSWLLLSSVAEGGERNRRLCILKSRGMAHSNQMREYVLTDSGVDLLDVYTGASGVLTGSARLAQEATQEADVLRARQEIERKERELARKEEAVEARIAAIRAEFASEKEAVFIGEDRSCGCRKEKTRMAGGRKK